NVVIPNPRVAQRAENELRRRQRALARCKRGSNRRRKVRAQVARLHSKIADTRNTWLHQQSAALIKRADLIAVEDLKVSNMVRHPALARSISDASWSKFVSMLDYKAEKAGGHLVRVDPRNTSQKCSGCGELVPKSLAVRTHTCPSCGLVIDRDHNARLLSQDEDALLKKIGEEATETVLAAKSGDSLQLVRETADLWFHCMIVLARHGLGPGDVLAEMHRREGISGIDEKAARKK